MKTKPIDHHRVAFVQGHESVTTGAQNPYILTSNCSDAFILGAMAANAGNPIDVDLHKSRGYTWRMNGRMYLVKGSKVKKVKAI